MTDTQPTDLETHSQPHIKEVYQFYRDNAPFKSGMSVKVHDENGKLWAIGKLVSLYWSDACWDWLCRVEIMEDIGLCIGEFSAGQLTRHTGFMGRTV